MRKFFYFLSAVAAMLLVPACSGEHHSEEAHAHHHEHGHDAHDHEGESHEGEDGEIVLEPERAEFLGVETRVIEPCEFANVIEVSGQIVASPANTSVVAAKSAGIVNFRSSVTPGAQISSGSVIASISAKGIAGGDANESAHAALNAAKRELDRMTPLVADGIVSRKDYNAALQAYEQAKAAATGSSSGSAAVASQSGVITALLVRQGEYVEAGTPIAEISSNRELTLEALLPENQYKNLSSVSSANFRVGSSPEVFSIEELGGKRLTQSTLSASRAGYIPVYFSFRNNGEIPIGAMADVYLLGRTEKDVLAVPLTALYEQQGQKFVFVKLDEECYEKRPVTVGGSNGVDCRILSGLKAGEDVVVKGTTFVRLAENAGAVPEGHTHSH